MLDHIGKLRFRPNYRLTVAGSPDYIVADLPSGDFETTLVGVRAFYGFNTNTLLNAFVRSVQRDDPPVELQDAVQSDPPAAERPVRRLQRMPRHVESRSIDCALIVKFTNLFDF